MVLERRCDGGGMCGEDADALFRQSHDATKMKKRKYIVANVANKQAKIYNNQLKQSRRRGLGIIKETPSGQTVL